MPNFFVSLPEARSQSLMVPSRLPEASEQLDELLGSQVHLALLQ
jgi:hypothetical protein